MERDRKDFVSYILSEKGLSYNTVEAYERDVLDLEHSLQHQGITSWKSVHLDHVIVFLSGKKTAGYASSSICRALIAVKVFFRFLQREGVVESNQIVFLESPKMWQLIPDVLSVEEMDKLLNQPRKDSLLGARDGSILEVLYATGIRVSELCQLKIYDVDDEFVKVMGKGGKERKVPIGRKAVESVDRYLSFREGVDTHGEPEFLFLSKNHRPMDRITVWKLVKDYAREAGVLKRISPHTFRHSYATHLLDNGADIRVIQELLGHVDISSTDRYTHVSMKQLKETFKFFHPRNF